MKNTLLLLLLVLGLQTANAQYVTIPDSNFRKAIIYNIGTNCFDANERMDTTCNGVINCTYLGISNRDPSIISLEGIQYFKNLKVLYCDNNRITTLDKLPETIERLYCYHNQITSITSLPRDLKYFACSYNNLTALPTLPDSLILLNFFSNHITDIHFLPNTIKYIECRYNNLSVLPFLPDSLIELQCGGNMLTALPALPSKLKTLNCHNNHITTLPPLPSTLDSLVFFGNHVSTIPSLPSTLKKLDCSKNPLSCLPLLPYNILYLYIKSTGITCLPNTINANVFIDSVLPVCTNASQICLLNPFVKGKVYIDVNNNNILDITDELLPEQIVKVLPNNWIGGSSIGGNYIVKLDTSINNIWSITSITNNYRYATATPVSYSKNPKDTIGILSGSYDFGIHLIPNVKDLESILGSSPAIPGFATNVTVTANNVGTINQSNITIKLKIPNGFNVLSSSITPTSTINDTLIWNNISINYLAHQSINITLQVPVNAMLGDSVVYEAWANGVQGDSTPIDNYTRWAELIVGSFDPNDKLVNKTSLPPTYDANKDRLLYTIRFQNTGTYTAFTVIVRDEIPNNLEVSSLRVVNASHPYQLIVREKNIVEVTFPNIQLPDSNRNEAKSHGFVQLEFKPKTGLTLNAEINNNASIFFDYNAPVITNTATTKIEITTSVASNRKLAFKLFPNPTSEMITVELPYTGNGKWILTDISGKVIKQNIITNNTSIFNVEVNDVSNGTYLMSLEMNGNTSTSKVVIMR